MARDTWAPPPRNRPRWLEFALGACSPVPAPPGPSDGTLFLELDDRQWRIAVHPGDAAELRYLGFGRLQKRYQ